MCLTWLDENLKEQIRRVFEPRYQKTLTDQEILEIAQNLTQFMEECLRFKWRLKNVVGS